MSAEITVFDNRLQEKKLTKNLSSVVRISQVILIPLSTYHVGVTFSSGGNKKQTEKKNRICRKVYSDTVVSSPHFDYEWKATSQLYRNHKKI
jgi:hypothetical protein